MQDSKWRRMHQRLFTSRQQLWLESRRRIPDTSSGVVGDKAGQHRRFNALLCRLRARLRLQFDAMNDVLHKCTVLVLNRNWQAINVRSPAQAFCMMANGNATALDIQEAGDMRPVKWSEWLELPVRGEDNAVRTIRGLVRVPTVLVLTRYNRVPKRRPKLSAKGIWERDGGRCQYTGRKLAPHEGNIDHVVPRSRGGQTTWENCVLADRRVNSLKGSRLPEEVGLELRKRPEVPRELPSTCFIRNAHNVSDWKHFLVPLD